MVYTSGILSYSSSPPFIGIIQTHTSNTAAASNYLVMLHKSNSEPNMNLTFLIQRFQKNCNAPL